MIKIGYSLQKIDDVLCKFRMINQLDPPGTVFETLDITGSTWQPLHRTKGHGSLTDAAELARGPVGPVTSPCIASEWNTRKRYEKILILS